MENNNYEQDFIKNVRATSRVAPPANKGVGSTDGASRLPLIVSIVLAMAVLVESIALIVFAVNYGEVLDLYGEDLVESELDVNDDSPEALSEGSIYNFDENYMITAFDLTCVADDGMKYSFTKAGDYEKTDDSSNIIDSGTYSILNGSVVVLNNSDGSANDKKKATYYDGAYFIEDTTFYTCEEE